MDEIYEDVKLCKNTEKMNTEGKMRRKTKKRRKCL